MSTLAAAVLALSSPAGLAAPFAQGTPPPRPGDGDVPEVRWEAYAGRAADGSPLTGRLGRITVPERRSAPEGATIELAFVVYESDADEPGPPIVYLAGGPGASGVELAGLFATDPRIRLLDHGDVIGIDQRGTGLSVPDLAAGPAVAFDLPLDRAVGRAELVAAQRQAIERCAAWWEERGVDLGAYDSAASADDVDDVRRALGLEHIVLYGESYGSHLGLAYLRRHAEHAARAVLMKVEGPDQTWKLPSRVQARLEHLGELVAADPALAEHLPDLVGTVRTVLERLEEQPATVTSEHLGTSVVVGSYDVQAILSQGLGFTSNLAGLPMAIHLMEQGEFRHLAGFVADLRRGELGSAMPIAMDCASGATRARRERIEREAKDPANLLGDAISFPLYLESCSACGSPDLGDGFRGPLRCDVPVLFVSGDLDARTPPENVEELRGGFSDHARVVVVNAGHDSRERESDELCGLVHAFLYGEPVDSTTIELPPLAFRPLRTE